MAGRWLSCYLLAARHEDLSSDLQHAHKKLTIGKVTIIAGKMTTAGLWSSLVIQLVCVSILFLRKQIKHKWPDSSELCAQVSHHKQQELRNPRMQSPVFQ